MIQKFNLQLLNISTDWSVMRNVFYDIDPEDNNSYDDKEVYIYCQEDLLYLTKGDYHLDLGWYGYNNLTYDKTGYCIHLFRGDNWNNAELLEKFRSKDKQVIVAKINDIIKAVDIGEFDNSIGYIVDENDMTNQNSFSDIDNYSVRLTPMKTDKTQR